jgi:hypothetical protein
VQPTQPFRRSLPPVASRPQNPHRVYRVVPFKFSTPLTPVALYHLPSVSFFFWFSTFFRHCHSRFSLKASSTPTKNSIIFSHGRIELPCRSPRSRRNNCPLALFKAPSTPTKDSIIFSHGRIELSCRSPRSRRNNCLLALFKAPSTPTKDSYFLSRSD